MGIKAAAIRSIRRPKRDLTQQHDKELIHSADLDLFFRSIGSIFITYITSSTLNNLLSSNVIKCKSFLCNGSLLQIFSSKLDMMERCQLFNQEYGQTNGIKMECSIWNLSYFINLNEQYDHQTTMKMIITYICVNGMHPFLGMDCDHSPFCQWSPNPICRVRTMSDYLLTNKDFYNINKYDFEYRDAWQMRANRSNLLIDVKQMMKFLFNSITGADDLASFQNQKFTLFTFKNECDYTYKIQFDIIHCNADLNVVDDFKISLFGNKIHFGSYCNDKDESFVSYWNEIKRALLGAGFVSVKSWYIVSIKHIDTSLHGNILNKCYYLICAEVDGTHLNKQPFIDQMFSKLLVWKSCFYSETQPYGHE